MRAMHHVIRTGLMAFAGLALSCAVPPTAPDGAPVGQGVGQLARRPPASGPDLFARCYCGYDGIGFMGWVRTENLGTETAGPSQTQVYLSLDRQLDPGDELLLEVSVPQLLPGALHDSRFEDLAHARPPDLFYLLTVADAAGAIGETNERNNAAAQKVWLR